MERADEEKVGWVKKGKHGHRQCLGAKVPFPLSAVNQEQEGIRVWLQDGEGPELQDEEPKGSDFVNSVMCVYHREYRASKTTQKIVPSKTKDGCHS